MIHSLFFSQIINIMIFNTFVYINILYSIKILLFNRYTILEVNILNRIKYLRVMYGDSQTELSKSIGVTQSTLSNWERSISMPDIESLKKISKRYASSIDFLSGSDSESDSLESIDILRAKLTHDLGRAPSSEEVQYFLDIYDTHIKFLKNKK